MNETVHLFRAVSSQLCLFYLHVACL